MTPVTALLLLLSFPLWPLEPPPPGPVLPPAAEAALRTLLRPQQPLADGARLNAAIERDLVRVTVGELEAPALAITLKHPDAAPAGAERVAGVAVVLEPGPTPEAVLGEVLGRLRAGGATVAWQVVRATGDEPPAPTGAALAEVEPTLVAARHKVDIGEPDAARALLGGLPAQLLPAAALEVALVYRRLGDDGAVARVLDASPATSPVDVAAAAVLRGGVVPSPPEAAEARCGWVYVAQLQRRLGALDAARGTAAEIRRAAPDCIGAWENELHSLVDGRQAEAAVALADQALERFPDDDRILAAAAAAYHVAGELARAVPLLERVARRQLESRNPLRVVLGAMVRDVANREAYRAGLRSRIEGAEHDVVARFLLGVLLHYENEFQASNELLLPLEQRLDHEDRLHIYLAMNDFNLGRVAPALSRLERVAQRPDPDPDVYYCIAEITRDTDRARSLVELRRYATMSAGSVLANPDKEVRIDGLLALLDACLTDGRETCEGAWEHPRFRHRRGADPVRWAVGLALVAALAGAFLLWRRRRGSG